MLVQDERFGTTNDVSGGQLHQVRKDQGGRRFFQVLFLLSVGEWQVVGADTIGEF